MLYISHPIFELPYAPPEVPSLPRLVTYAQLQAQSLSPRHQIGQHFAGLRIGLLPPGHQTNIAHHRPRLK